MAQAREQFLGLVAGVRPELHRYCAAASALALSHRAQRSDRFSSPPQTEADRAD
jgi:hypothetical protein